MQAVGYARVSTEGQATEGVSLEAQRAKITAWCVANDRTLQAFFVDAGLSGARADNRPQLQLALAAVCAKGRAKEPAGNVLVVYSLSRLARSVRDTIAIAERLDKAGADLVSLSEKIDTTSAAGRMIFRMLAVLAEFERDLISERTSAALQHMKSRGKRVGQVPFGYDAIGDELKPNPAEQAVIARIVQRRREGATLRQIAAELSDVPTKAGARWHAAVIMRILAASPRSALTASK